jgi:bifunctional non-homologous end joining protein LigD
MARRARPGAQKSNLTAYRAKRDFTRTSEPRGDRRIGPGRRFVVQKHAARSLHYDFRLEHDGVFMSFAVTRGPSLDPGEKRLAVRVEDHPLEYGGFEGTIPAGEYGGGTVMLWDRGTWTPIDDPEEGLRQGKLSFRLDGERLKGEWTLVRMQGRRARGDRARENWLLIKADDEAAERHGDILEHETKSVASGRSMEEIAHGGVEWIEGAARSKPRRKAAAKAYSTSGAGARRRSKPSLPDFIAPELATLVDDVPQGKDWLFEVKFDGYRALIAVAGAQAKIYTRNGIDWTGRFPGLARALATLGLDGVLIDGEIVVVDDQGRSDFAALQNAMNQEAAAVSLFAFDLPVDKGRSLAKMPLFERKARLKEVLSGGRQGPVFFSDHVRGNGRAMLEWLCQRGFEGLIAKLASSPYRSGRWSDWLKVKCEQRQEFVIAGTSPSERARPFASLLLGVHGPKGLSYAGRVGSGLSQQTLVDLESRFRGLARDTSPFVGKVARSIAKGARWLEPRLVAEVAFAGLTRDKLIRQGRFKALREDKPAEEVGIEKAKPVEQEQIRAEKGRRTSPAQRRMGRP